MSLENINNSFNDVLNDFGEVMIDPYIYTVLSDMRIYNDLLATQPITKNEVYAIMHELDEKWSAFINQEASVTGSMSFLASDSSDSFPMLDTDFYEDETVIFGGVLPVATDVPIGTPIADEELHTYRLHIQVKREALDTDGDVVQLLGSASVDELATIDMPNVMSSARAKKWLEYYHAPDIDEIDVDILAAHKEECEMVLSLNGHSVDIGTPHRNDPDLMQRSAQALNLYTNKHIIFDTDVPYLMKTDGHAWEQGQNGEYEPAYVVGQTMVKLDRIIWTQRDEQPDNVVYPHVMAKLLGTTKDDPDRWMVIDVSAIQSLRSFRYDYFIGYDD